MTERANPTTTRRADGQATAAQVVAVAERLFAERGIEAVSLREVGKAAHSRNTAVAHYHFGGKEGLIRAIVAERAPVLDARRLELLTQARAAAAERGGEPSVDALVRAVALPFAEEVDRGGHYVPFLARLGAERHRTPWVADLDEHLTAGFTQAGAMLADALPGLDRRRFAHRRDLMVTLIVGALAARVLAETAGRTRMEPRAAFVADLLEAATGLMLAPVGPEGRDPRAR